MIYENDPNRPGYVPFPEPHHVRQPYPYPVPPRHFSDLEPAFVVRPDEECCPSSGDDCVCVTSGDVIRWDRAADILEGLTEEEIEALSSVSAFTDIANSAELWNTTYGIVSSHSAMWDEISALSSFSADTEKKFDEIDNEFDDYLSALSAVNDRIPEYYFDTKENHDPLLGTEPSITGNGSRQMPFGVNGWQPYSNLRNDLNTIVSHIIPITANELVNGKLEPRAGEQFKSLANFYDAAGFIFDGNKYYFDKVLEDYVNMQHVNNDLQVQVDILDNNLTEVSTSASKALAGLKTYHGSDHIKVIPKADSTTDFHIYLDVNGIGDLPGVDNDVYRIANEAVNAALNAKSYVEFKELGKYPKSMKDISDKTAMNVIFFAAQ